VQKHKLIIRKAATLLYIIALLCDRAEMHRHSDWEGIPGESGRRKRHLQLPGLIIISSQLFTDNPGKVCTSAAPICCPCAIFLLALILSYFEDFLETNYLSIYWPAVTVFSPNGRYFIIDDRSHPCFLISQGILQWQPNLGTKWLAHLHSAHWCSKEIGESQLQF